MSWLHVSLCETKLRIKELHEPSYHNLYLGPLVVSQVSFELNAPSHMHV